MPAIERFVDPSHVSKASGVDCGSRAVGGERPRPSTGASNASNNRPAGRSSRSATASPAGRDSVVTRGREQAVERAAGLHVGVLDGRLDERRPAARDGSPGSRRRAAVIIVAERSMPV